LTEWLFTIASKAARTKILDSPARPQQKPVIVIGSDVFGGTKHDRHLPEWLFRWPLVYVCGTPLGNHLRQFIA
jgi:hypothetical protein